MTNKQTESNVTRGKGVAGTVAIATTALPKATAVTPPAVVSTVTRGGLGTTPPATAPAFDRSVATPYGK